MPIPHPANKRRRLDDALRKPFVSPMRAPKPATALRESPSKAHATPPAYRPSTLAHTITPTPAALHGTPRKATLQRTHRPSTWSTKTLDPEVASAQKAVTSLEQRLRRAQSDLDTLQEAARLRASATDADLAALREKWRAVSQALAEELFGQVKERVQRMGGVAAWREMERRRHDRAGGRGEFAAAEQNDGDDDADCEFDEQGEELPEEEQAYRKEMKRQVRREMMDAADAPEESSAAEGGGEVEKKVWQEDGRDDDTFTMDMMLRSLNIDLAVIGYDQEAQRWI